MARGTAPALLSSLLLLGAWLGDSRLLAQEPPRQDPVVESPARRALEAAWSALEAGDLPLAERRFQAAIDSGVARGWGGLAEVRRREGDLEGAADALWELHGALPGDLEVKRELAALLARLPGHEWEAYPLNAELLEQLPADPTIRLQMARLQSVLGWHEEARANFARVAASGPPAELAVEAELGLADDYNRAGLRHRAEEIYRRHLGDPPDPRALRGLADLEFRQGRPAQAAALYEQVMESDPDDFEARERGRAARAAQGPRLFARAQSYSDNRDWTRTKILGGVDFAVGAETRLRVGLESARFEDGAGRELDRNSLVVRGDWRPDPFVVLHADLQSGDQGGGSNPRGGLGVLYEPTESAVFRGGYRHDDALDPADPFAFDGRNDAADVRLLSGAGLQSETFYASAAYTPPDQFGFAGSAEGGTIQDLNNRSLIHLQVHRSAALGAGWRLTPRGYYQQRHYQAASPLYFSPSNLESWGAGFRLDAWSYDRRREAYLDLAGFYLPSGIDDWGVQADAGLQQRLGDASSLDLRLSWLSSAERAPGPQLRSFALMVGFALAF